MTQDSADLVVTLPTAAILDSYRAPRRNPGRRRLETFVPESRYSKYLVQTALVRSAEYDGREGPVVANSKAAADACRWLNDLDQEHFAVLCLGNSRRVRALHIVSIGTSSATMVAATDLFKAAVLSGSTGVILIHNHPGGDPTPSKQDLDLTRRAIEEGRCIGIAVLDHIIVSHDSHVSLGDHGMLGI